jgi:hypothetical protein
VPLLIDGNNLLYALAEVGPEVERTGLVELLAELAEAGEQVTVVFDGPPPPPQQAGQLARRPVEALFSGQGTADEIIVERIDADSAPRRLTVVSTDREIRKAARRRRCRIARSEDFARQLLAELRRLRTQPPPPVEPAEKHQGLDKPEQRDHWLRAFDLEHLIGDEDEDPMA